jgi:hypothetical protein
VAVGVELAISSLVGIGRIVQDNRLEPVLPAYTLFREIPRRDRGGPMEEDDLSSLEAFLDMKKWLVNSLWYQRIAPPSPVILMAF